MPQILSLAGFEYYRAWRPHGPMNALGIPHQFVWRGIDGSEIVVTRGSYGYVGGRDAPPVRYNKVEWDTVVGWLYENHFRDQTICDRSPTDNLWIIQGYDDARPMTISHADLPFDVQGLVAKWREYEDTPIRWCTPIEYSRAVAEQKHRLAVVEGVIDGADCGYNLGNHGSHGLWMWRQMNDRRLVGAELWAAAAAPSGFSIPGDELKELWYQHCIYQAHAQDFAFQDDWNYLVDMARNVQWRAERIQEEAISALVRAAGGGTRTSRLIFNQHPWPLKADVEIYHPCAIAGVESLQVVDENGSPFEQQQLSEFRHPRFGGSVNDERRLVRIDLPAMGYRRVEVLEKVEPALAHPTEPEDGVVETASLRLVYRSHALREVHDLAGGCSYASREGGTWPDLRFHVLDHQNWLLDGPELRRERFVPESSEWLQTGPLRWHHRSRGTVGPYAAWLDTLVADCGRELQVRVRLDGHWEKAPETGFVTLMGDIEAGGAMTVDVPFAVEPRDPDRDIYVDNAPTGDELGIVRMFERLRPGIFWGRTWADWSGEGQGVTMISTNGNYYWIKEPGQFGHVLLRCIELREGTWEAFCPQTMTGTGTHEFAYAMRFHDGDWRQADPQHRALELRHPPIVARADYPTHATLHETQHSFLSLEGPALLTAHYADGEDVYIRLYESRGEGGEVKLALDWAPEAVEAVDFLGQPVDVPIGVRGRAIKVTARPWQIITLRMARP